MDWPGLAFRAVGELRRVVSGLPSADISQRADQTWQSAGGGRASGYGKLGALKTPSVLG